MTAMRQPYEMPGKSSTGVQLIGQVDDPVKAFVVKLAPTGGREEYLFFDRTSGLLVRDQELRDGQRLVTTYEDFRPLDGAVRAWHIYPTATAKRTTIWTNT